MGDMFLPLKRYFEFSGRSRRREYWLFLLLYTVLLVAATVLDLAFGLVDYSSYYYSGDNGLEASFNISLGPFSVGALLLFIVPLFAVTVRRMHDVDKSGWFMLVPFYNFILTCIEGTPGPNRFGPDPKGDPRSQIFS